MGILIDPELARRSKCGCFRFPSGGIMCHVPGIIGFTSDKQEELYCPEKEFKPIPRGLEERWEEFTEIAHGCSVKVRKLYPKGERLLPYLDCMSEEASKRKLEI